MVKKAQPEVGGFIGIRKGKLNIDDYDEKVAELLVGSEVPRRRDRKRTLSELQHALNMLQRQGGKITMAAVSQEAGVSPALIHNRYPDFAEQVRAIIGKGIRQQRDDKASELNKAKERIRELNQLVATQNEQISKLASVNEMLVKELAIQTAIVDGKVARGQFGQKSHEPDPSKGSSKP